MCAHNVDWQGVGLRDRTVVGLETARCLQCGCRRPTHEQKRLRTTTSKRLKFWKPQGPTHQRIGHRLTHAR
eukprot:9416835-Alexandrium_andersonii.AAC.1